MAEACRAVVEVEQSRCSAGAEDQCSLGCWGQRSGLWRRVRAQGQGQSAGSAVSIIRCYFIF